MRSAVERNLLRDNNNVKVLAETFRIITVQDLAKLHHNLDDMAKIRPPDLMLEGFEWRARPLDKVRRGHARGAEALHPRGSDGAVCQGLCAREAKVRVRQGNLHGREFEGLVQRPVIRDTTACLFREQTRQKPNRTHTDRRGPLPPLPGTPASVRTAKKELSRLREFPPACAMPRNLFF